LFESAQESIDIFSEVIQTVDYNIEKNRKQYSELNQEIDNLRENLVDYDINDRSDLNQLKGMESELLDEIKQLENKENPYDSQLKMAQDMFVDLDELKESRASIETDIKHVTYLVRLLTDSKSFIRKRIVDRFIPYLNKKIVQYTGQLGLPHICTINSDLSVDIEYMTKNVSYYNMSQGERMRLNIATTAALKALLALLGTKIDTMFVDEVLDSSMDSGGMLKAFEFIKEHSKNLLLISHREELIGSVDNKMTIVKRNGFSIIE
jgi:DNA repair exonuclease SbcCD ATPase subunit